MAYKTRYRPIEVLGPAGWSLLRDDPQPQAVDGPRPGQRAAAAGERAGVRRPWEAAGVYDDPVPFRP